MYSNVESYSALNKTSIVVVADMHTHYYIAEYECIQALFRAFFKCAVQKGLYIIMKMSLFKLNNQLVHTIRPRNVRMLAAHNTYICYRPK